MAAGRSSGDDHDQPAGTITSIRALKPARAAAAAEPRFAIEIDHQPWAELEAETVVRQGLKSGFRLASTDRQRILHEDQILKARRWAAARCAAKPRSRRALELELARRRFPQVVIECALDQLEAAGTLDDRRVAVRHVRKRARERGSGPARVLNEIIGMGVSADIARAAIQGGMNEGDVREACLDLARKRSPRYEPLADPRNQRRLIQFLQRRGFEAELVARTIEALLIDEPQ